MTKNYLFYIIFMMMLITLLAFILNIWILVPPSKDQTLIPQEQVVSVALYYEDQPFIMNFSQQKELIKLVNGGTQKNKIELQTIQPFATQNKIQKISIQRFRRPALELKPLGLLDDKMIFQTETENGTLFIIEKDEKSFESLFKATYDH